ncbi:recombinase family protein [Sphingobium cloacae]|uniref:Resolvase domain-containing protein n=1 Tax=Sphingobium cloacae TaxID=120107 RepID=A0A1E1EYD7_9SPHN|nr:recombinase family protein [Sphingobium cloacae]BAV63286.1 resolvase domain-containing protein [Sphingobium cloacae]
MTSAALQRYEDEAPVLATSRAALYLRVSTPRQAEHDLSIPDQRRQMENYCTGKGWEIATEFVEPGNTATDDRRPSFQAMIDAAMEKPPAFNVIVVHSFSRFFRDQFQFEFYVRKLAKNGVKLVSITQDLGDDPMSVMMRQIMTLFDEYQSKENAKHTLRAMNENARQGFWNGARAPIGYRIVVSEQRGAKLKKKLEIDPIHAETVRLIYRMALNGIDNSGAMGLKRIATWLNDNNIRTRTGGRWGLAAVHQVLTRTTYIGEHRFNTRDHKTRTPKPQAEHAVMEVPPIVTRVEWEAVQRSLKARSPMAMPPRAVGGTTLLTGICFCACCGGAMTLRTGTSSVGREYRYYTCSTKARQGAKGCPGLTIPMDKLDSAVAEHLETRLLEPKRLEALMDQIIDRRDEWVDRRRQHVAELERRATEAETKLKRLYEAIEDGLIDMRDSSLKDRIAELTVIRDQTRGDAERAVAHIEKIGPAITAESLRRFALAAKRKLRNDDGSFARDHLRAVAQRVEVVSKTEVRILGTRTELLRTLTAASGVEAAVLGVRGFEPKWRARNDSNVRPSDS